MGFKNCFISEFLMHPYGPCFIKVDHVYGQYDRDQAILHIYLQTILIEQIDAQPHKKYCRSDLGDLCCLMEPDMAFQVIVDKE
jgi:hypothetical protein